MPTLKSSETTHVFSLEEVKGLIAKDFGVNPMAIRVRYVIEEVGGDPHDERYSGVDQVTRIEVTVDHNTRY